VKRNLSGLSEGSINVLEKEQRKALRKEAKEIREAFGSLWGEDKETRQKRETLQARYVEIERILKEERQRVLKECRSVWEDFAALRADQDEQRESLMARYKELYHILRKRKEDKAHVKPGSDEDIPSPDELAAGKQPPGSEVVFDFTSFVVSEETNSSAAKPTVASEAPLEPPTSEKQTVLGALPVFSETGEVTLTPSEEDEKNSDIADAPSENETDGFDFFVPSLEETGGLPLFSPDDLVQNKDKDAAPLRDEVWVEKEAEKPREKEASSLDDLDLDDILSGNEYGKKKPEASEAPEVKKQATPKQEDESKSGFLDATWDSSPDTKFPESFKRDESIPGIHGAQGSGAPTKQEKGLPPLPQTPAPAPSGEDKTTDSGSWDKLPKQSKDAGAAPNLSSTPIPAQKPDDEDEGDVVFG